MLFLTKVLLSFQAVPVKQKMVGITILFAVMTISALLLLSSSLLRRTNQRSVSFNPLLLVIAFIPCLMFVLLIAVSG